ncbi:MAG: DEAD/DEAH box helicase, partial [Clostridiaceae bacterium]|nr:DEAD/DEAH box helicase [Clostridiaceae bacterium]
MRFTGLLNTLDSSKKYQQLITGIKGNNTPANLIGVSQTVAAHLVWRLGNELSKTALIVVPDALTAKNVVSDLKLFMGDKALLFPERELIFYDVDAQTKDIISERLYVLYKLAKTEATAVVVTISALLGFVTPKEVFDSVITLKTGDIFDFQNIGEIFIQLGYTREELVEGKGQFAIRGGIIDFFPHTCENPVRIELFSDEIDSIREFDPITQRSLDTLEYVDITPAGEVIISSEQKKALISKLELLSQDADKSLSEKINRDIERFRNNIDFPSVDKYIPFIYDDLPTLFDYLKHDSLVFIYEPTRISENGKNNNYRFAEQIIDFINKSILVQTEKVWQMDYYDIIEKMHRHCLIGFLALSESSPDYRPKLVIGFNTKEQSRFYGKIDLFIEAVRFYKNNGYSTVVFCGNVIKAKNIAEALCNEDIIAAYHETIDRPPQKGQVIITHGEITQGFEYPDIKLAVIGDKEIFGYDRKPTKRKLRKEYDKLTSFTDLSAGDYIVHQNHGIGQFIGIKTMTIDGATTDYLQIRFKGNDFLYVPTNQLDLIYKYLGKGTVEVKLNKLGGTEWQKTKQKVKENAKEMAEQLIRLYAARQDVKGIAFSPDSEWHNSFAATFPYEETEDQLRCFDEVSADMEKAHPMDRLLCGDAGYGKTEVALRAAFKAVMDGYQVAYLVPTTILASQHYNTFTERMKGFPIKVEMLSRFRTAKQQKETVNHAKSGTVDIVIGTHRILQKDLKYNKLGLIIIDEEQRFGVAHKEHLKELKSNVDVLTLSATPIPRTLHMSLSGIRDMSVLENPPKNRYPVSTYVLEYNDQIIGEAIQREIARGGQVFYLHNRVESIEHVATRIHAISPDFRIAVAHGKMGENELEGIMNQVLKGEIDILVCTT